VCFVPERPLERYCSAECRKAAARWSAWKARQKYRQTERAKALRREQSRRHRARRKEAEELEGHDERAGDECGVGHVHEVPSGFFRATVRGATRSSS